MCVSFKFARNFSTVVHRNYSKDLNSDLYWSTRDLIRNENWVENKQLQPTIEKNLKQLQNSYFRDNGEGSFIIKESVENIHEWYSRLKRLIQERKSGISYKQTSLQFCKIRRTIGLMRKYWEVARKFELEAQWKKEIAYSEVAAVSRYKKELADDSQALWNEVIESLRIADRSIYIATDCDESTQGIAIVRIQEKMNKKITVLKYLGTNPANLLILGNEKNMVKGVGSGLIHKICQDIVMNPEVDKSLELQTSGSAWNFYGGLGFTHLYKDYMVLTEENMIKLNNAFGKLKI